MTLEDIAKAAAERAGKNAGVAPELLYAHILWELQDAAEINRLLNLPVDELRKEVSDGQVAATRRVLERCLTCSLDDREYIDRDGGCVDPWHYRGKTSVGASLTLTGKEGGGPAK